MFRSVLRPSSGVRFYALRNYYVSACILRCVPVCGGILALYLSVWCPDVYTSGHHTDKYSASIHKQITYHHIPEHSEVCRLTRSNYTRQRNGPLTMVGRLTETCWVFC
jgi:hypothetical protein